MKKLIFLLTVISIVSHAQSVETISSTSDSVDIREMVLQQINNARQRQYAEVNNPQLPVVPNDTINEPVKEEIQQASLLTDKLIVPEVKKASNKSAAINVSFFQPFLQLPLQYQIFIAVSITIVSFVILRRTLYSLNKRSKKALKKKIGMLREEKVGGAKINPKIQKTRKILKDNLEIFKHNDKQLSKNAKQLSISKGELLLAARLKLLEVGKM